LCFRFRVRVTCSFDQTCFRDSTVEPGLLLTITLTRDVSTDRTQRALDRAREIGESGVTGGFEKEFEEIERILDSIPLNFTSGQEEIAQLVELIT